MYEEYLPDARLAERAKALQDALTREQSACVRRVAQDRAEEIAFGRFLRNRRVEEGALIEGLCARARRALQALPAEVHLLAIQDTTQFNLESHRGRRKPDSGLGVIGDGKSAGFFLHPTLLVSASEGHALGFSDVELWSRPADQPSKKERNYKQLPLEEKESFRWPKSVEDSRARLGPGVRLTGVADCEGDAYPLFARVPDERTGLIVRICRDRKIQGTPELLFAHLAGQPVLGREEVEIRGDVRKRRSARRAILEYRVSEVLLSRPRTWARESAQCGMLWALEVREAPESVPAEGEPIHWRILTSHPAGSFSQARQVVAWYRERWHIEQIFRLLKTDGLNLEESELESGYALRRLSILALGAALDVLRLLRAERAESEQPVEQVFDPTQQKCLHALAERVQGRTQALSNPHPPDTLGWAAWIIARLGGWSGYRSQRPAGPLVYRRGLTRFALLCKGLSLAPHDLYTP